MKYKKYRIFTLILLFYNVLFSNVSNKEISKHFETIFKEGNDLYSQNKFVEAIDVYSKILDEISSKQKYSAEIFYNIGNCYFRLNKLGYARYYYELAKLVDSRDKDIIYNLKYVKKLSNNEEVENILFKIYDYFSLRQLNRILFLFNLSFFIFLICSFFIKVKYIKITRNIFFIFLIIFILLFLGKYNSYLKVYGIVVEPVGISSSPDENFVSNMVMVNEGKKVIILSEKDNFYAVYLPFDNLQGWIKKDNVKLIKI